MDPDFIQSCRCLKKSKPDQGSTRHPIVRLNCDAYENNKYKGKEIPS